MKRTIVSIATAIALLVPFSTSTLAVPILEDRISFADRVEMFKVVCRLNKEGESIRTIIRTGADYYMTVGNFESYPSDATEVEIIKINYMRRDLAVYYSKMHLEVAQVTSMCR